MIERTLAALSIEASHAGNLSVFISLFEKWNRSINLSAASSRDERAATPVAFTGGMLTKGTTLRKRLEHRLKSAVPGAQIRAGEVNAARGAVRSALRYVGDAAS
jgi:hypothetical protein